MAVTGRKSRVVKVESSPVKKPAERFPWPRKAPDDEKVDLGVDVVAKQTDITKIVHKYFRVPDYPMEELMQEVFLAIIHKNYTRSAHDPRKSSFGHYVYMVADHVCVNIVHRKRRYEKERESLDAPLHDDDNKTLLDSVEAPEEENDPMEWKLEEIELTARRNGMTDIARYIHATRSGASPEVIREALSWGGRKITTKCIRDIRMQIRDLVESMQTA
jgi:DNA-directed RNA polymerase specialized sigma24 family protein